VGTSSTAGTSSLPIPPSAPANIPPAITLPAPIARSSPARSPTEEDLRQQLAEESLAQLAESKQQVQALTTQLETEKREREAGGAREPLAQRPRLPA
jgi:hypothetical protein